LTRGRSSVTGCRQNSRSQCVRLLQRLRRSFAFPEEFIAPSLQTGSSAQFVVSTDLRAEIVVAASQCLGIKPQTAFLRFLTSSQSRELLIDLIDQLLR